MVIFYMLERHLYNRSNILNIFYVLSDRRKYHKRTRFISPICVFQHLLGKSRDNWIINFFPILESKRSITLSACLIPVSSLSSKSSRKPKMSWINSFAITRGRYSLSGGLTHLLVASPVDWISKLD